MDGVPPTFFVSSPLNQGFVLRFWGEPTAGGRFAWRASVTNLESREKVSFSTPAQLDAYFRNLGIGWPADSQAAHPPGGGE